MSRGRPARGSRSHSRGAARSASKKTPGVSPQKKKPIPTVTPMPQETRLEPIRLGFVRGVAPSKWAERWQRASTQVLELVPVSLGEVEAARTSVDVLLERTLPGETPPGTDPAQQVRHAVRLYEEQVALVIDAGHELASQKSLTVEELALVRLLDHPDHGKSWPAAEPWSDPSWMPKNAQMTLELVSTGTGAALMSQPLAQHLSKKREHAVLTVAAHGKTSLGGSSIWATWQRERDRDDVQQLIGFLRGRTARSSR